MLMNTSISARSVLQTVGCICSSLVNADKSGATGYKLPFLFFCLLMLQFSSPDLEKKKRRLLMFGKNEMKVCYAESGLEEGEGGFTKYEGTATSSSTALPLWLLLVEGTREMFKLV